MEASTASGERPTTHSAGSVSIPFTIGAAVLVGLGMTGMAYWLITFHWILLASLIPLIGGGLLLFSRFTGPDHA